MASSNPHAPNHDRSAGANRPDDRTQTNRENAILRANGYSNEDLRALGRL